MTQRVQVPKYDGIRAQKPFRGMVFGTYYFRTRVSGPSSPEGP